jgi:ribosomal protein L11 methyltransferase
MPDRSSKQIEIRLTTAQRERIRWQTGLDMPSIRMSLIELELLTKVAIAAGSETLPITPSAIKQVSEPAHISDSFVIEVNLTTKQKEQIKRTTDRNISSLRIVPDDYSPSYREIWTDVSATRIGRTMVIKRANDASEILDTDRVIVLPACENSGRDVFGTGRHPATQLSLVLLEEYVESGDRVLDLGTGSGILAVAAARLGAREVLALDIEAAAVATAQNTVAVNALEGTIEVRQGSIESAAPPYDVVAANIFPSVTIHLASDLATNVRRAGVFISSGSVAARAQDVADALCATGFQLEQQCSQNVWRGMAFRKV